MCPKIAEMGVRLWHVCSWCARWRILRCWGFAAISQLRNECTGLPNGTHVPKSGFVAAKYPAKWSFDCEIGSFCALGFRSRFAVAKWGSLCCEMALVCQKVASQLRNPVQNGAFLAKMGSFMLWWFAVVSQLRNDGHYVAKWHSCAKSGFAAAKIFAERAIGLRTGFATKFRFRRGCEISQTPVFPLFLPCFSLRLTPILLRFCSDFFSSISLQFLLILIIQKPILHQNKLELKHWNQN